MGSSFRQDTFAMPAYRSNSPGAAPAGPNSTSRRTFLAGLAGAATVLSGCGGGSSSSPSDNIASPNQPTEPDLGPDIDPPVEPPEPPAPFPPRGVHASIEESSLTSRSITWFTDTSHAPAQRLEYDQEPLLEGQQNTPVFLHQRQASSEATFGVDAQTHRIKIDGLDPDKPVRYRVGSPSGGWSPVYQLTPINTQNWSFVHYGDQGVSVRAQRVTEEILKQPRDLAIIAGDLSYADGEQSVWDTWFDLVEPLLANTITMAAAGNHESKDGDGLQSGKAFKSRLTHPDPLLNNLNPNPGSTYYGFDIGRVHFFVSSAGALIDDFTLAEELINLEIDLAKAALRRARGELDFIILIQHYPIWTDQDGRSPANLTLVALQENILLRYGVDLLLVGHDHIYQRSVPMGFGIPSRLGYVQVLTGTGGQSVRLFDDNGIQRWSASEFVGIGFSRFEVEPGRIKGYFYGAAPQGLGDDVRQTVTDPFALHDEFEVEQRDWLACQNCALPARPASELLQDFPALVAHTRERNRRAMEHHSHG